MDRLTRWVVVNVRWLKSQLTFRGRTREEAEDLIQEAYLRVFEYCEKGKAREPEKVLVRTVMNLSMNRARDERRRSHATQAVDELELLDPSPPLDEVLAAEQKLRHVLQAIARLDARTAEAFVLNRVDGLTYKQIGKRMGLSVSAVEKRIAWAMAVVLDASERENEPSRGRT